MADTDTKTANSARNAPAATPSPNVSSNSDVAAAEVRVQEAERAAVEAKRSPEERKAAEARQEADDARAKAAADAAEANAVPRAMSIEEARIPVVPHPDKPDMGAGDHLAQNFQNIPENPKVYKGEHADPEKCTVQLYMTRPDLPAGVATTVVHPDMVGDYCRAGWSQTPPPGVSPVVRADDDTARRARR
jgi:hypothetical protein